MDAPTIRGRVIWFNALAGAGFIWQPRHEDQAGREWPFRAALVSGPPVHTGDLVEVELDPGGTRVVHVIRAGGVPGRDSRPPTGAGPRSGFTEGEPASTWQPMSLRRG